MEKEKSENSKNRTGNNRNIEDRVFFKKWSVVLPLVFSIITFLAGWFLGSQQSKRQLEHSKTQLEYSTAPNCALQFVPAGMEESTKPHFLLRNLGPGRLDDVWLKETVFLADTEGVHECLDLPHFEYIYYCGSTVVMDSLEVGELKRIDLSPCWWRSFDLFSKKFSGKLVSRFRLTGSALASPEFRKDFFFVIERKSYEYITPEEYIGGKELVDSVILYTHRGPRSIIRFVSFFDFQDFFKNPPKFFYQKGNGKYIPWDGPDLPPVSPAVMPIYFSRYTVLPQKGGSVKLIWDCDALGPIAEMFECRPGVW
ncbi:MAG: hypothetical protein MUO91_05440 [candidate division Zixibacteria bacterium]|nr:hypothetical protein [candidate division Zixibacteria bacterium]